MTVDRFVIGLLLLMAAYGALVKAGFLPDACDDPRVVCQGHFIGVYP